MGHNGTTEKKTTLPDESSWEFFCENCGNPFKHEINTCDNCGSTAIAPIEDIED